MPVSTSAHITQSLAHIIGLSPASVLDIGCGFGKWGYLCREYLDVFVGRVQPREWTTRIDGIEFFEPYIMAHQRALYNQITIGDICERCKDIDEYELIIAGDVIEHIDKDVAEVVVETLYSKATRALLVNIPIGEGWIHPEAYGNPAELHRSVWYPEDFAPYDPYYHGYEFPAGLQYGTFFCQKPVEPVDRLDGYMKAANRYQELNDGETALRYLMRAHELDPNYGEAVLGMADCLIQQGKVQEGVATIEQCLESNPDFFTGHLMLAKLFKVLGAKEKAAAHLNTIISNCGLAEMRQEAEAVLAQL